MAFSATTSSALRGFVATPDFVAAIAPAFRAWMTGPRLGWPELTEAAGHVRVELGISQHAWGQACVVLGRQEAVVALAAIAARHERGLVRSPGGLLRHLVDAHREGTLRLDRTLFGLADGIVSKPRPATAGFDRHLSKPANGRTTTKEDL